MPLLEQITTDLKQAMLSGDKTATETLRMLKSAITYVQTQESATELSEAELIKIIRREVKKRHEAAESFRKAGSPDRAEQEEAEAKVLEHYLPAQIDPGKVEEYLQNLRKENPDLPKGDAIRQTLTHFDGQTDGKIVSGLVNRLFN